MTLMILAALIPNISQLVPQLLAQYGAWVYLLLFGVIFIETGVVILPFLPGDSLLFLCGSLAALANDTLNIWGLVVVLGAAAVVGDALNFEIGEHFGTYLTTNQRLVKIIKPTYLARSQAFFQKHGKSAIFLGRFMPIIRTFVPFTAGISKMRYRDFALYNILGGVSWVTVAVCAGYLFGNIPFIKGHFELIMVAIIVLSLLPAAVMAVRKRGVTPDAD